jgi:hypothetical protein
MDYFFWIIDFPKFIQPDVGQFHNPDMGFNGAKRIIFSWNAGFCQGIK